MKQEQPVTVQYTPNFPNPNDPLYALHPSANVPSTYYNMAQQPLQQQPSSNSGNPLVDPLPFEDDSLVVGLPSMILPLLSTSSCFAGTPFGRSINVSINCAITRSKCSYSRFLDVKNRPSKLLHARFQSSLIKSRSDNNSAPRGANPKRFFDLIKAQHFQTRSNSSVRQDFSHIARKLHERIELREIDIKPDREEKQRIKQKETECIQRFVGCFARDGEQDHHSN